MSYILDALRRSQAERERGQVPGLNAQPTPLDSPTPQRRVAPGVWLGLGLAIGVLGAAAAWLTRSPPAVVVVEGSASAVVRPGAGGMTGPAQTGMPSSTPMPAPTSPPATSAAEPQLPRVVSAPSTLPAPPTAAPVPDPFRPAEPRTAAGTPSQSPLQSQSPQPSPSQTQPQSQTPSQSPAQPPTQSPPTSLPLPLPSPSRSPPPDRQAPPPPPAPAARPVPLAELTAEQRRDLPPMTVGGSIWSDNPGSRFVIVNGQVVREGEAAAPGVTLERIGPKALVLRWRDLRVEVSL